MLKIIGIALPLACQCQNNGLVKYWLKNSPGKLICGLSPLNDEKTVDTAQNPKQTNNQVFPYDETVDWSKLEALEDNKLKVDFAKSITVLG